VGEAVSADVRPIVVPASNEEGVERALAQIGRLVAPSRWVLRYEWHTDTLSVRASGHGPAVSYFLPDRPEVLLRLDAYSGDLTGIDLTDYRRVLVKTDPGLRHLLARYLAVRLLAIIPPLHPVASRQASLAAERVSAATVRFCPQI
jgi:hypothetical protein